MAARVTSSEVKVIVSTSIADVTTPFIDMATLIVDEDLADTGMSAARLTKIELYLAAHFVVMTEERGGLTRTRTGDAEDYFRQFTGDGLKSSRYGVAAMQLDSSGVLSTIGQHRATFEAL